MAEAQQFNDSNLGLQMSERASHTGQVIRDKSPVLRPNVTDMVVDWAE
jgi:hypothetical protein